MLKAIVKKEKVDEQNQIIADRQEMASKTKVLEKVQEESEE